jgi:hypothetical protein
MLTLHFLRILEMQVFLGKKAEEKPISRNYPHDYCNKNVRIECRKDILATNSFFGNNSPALVLLLLSLLDDRMAFGRKNYPSGGRFMIRIGSWRECVSSETSRAIYSINITMPYR